ncbi:Cellulose synthase [Macleaya cordata]|uniref:Cellulose synthase n=1 Tax=Macleaya cordata TaxID=56857 RepID=A0A200QCW4_MACCD|nr:Cellulose synthase [Macleaya cordata]
MMNVGGHERKSFSDLNTFQVHPRTKPNRVLMVIYMCAILALLYHHLLYLIRSISLPSLSLFFADLVFAFMWVTSQPFRWRPIRRKVYPENLSRTVDDKDLPPLDVFICTADPYKEPPMEVVNTVLSVLAFDYPSDKISVYVSDDGGSQMTLFAMMEGSRFAKRTTTTATDDQLSCSQQEFQKMKILYEQMKARVELVMERGYVEDDMITTEKEREAFIKWKRGFSRQDHPVVVQVILESNKDIDISGESLPNLIYLSREKRKKFHHNFKAGALNVLIRVSAIMTNAPIVLSLDCDMFCNDPQAPRQALCHLLDPIEGSKIAFVQFPQRYRGINSSDIYNNELKRPFKINAEGLDGLGVVNYVGTGPFINRKAFYGGPLTQTNVNTFPGFNNDKIFDRNSINSRLVLEEAERVAGCKYEQGTNWGLAMGFRYGSLVEDFFTGYRMQCEGWQGVFCDPQTPAFLGDFPISLNDTLIQVKRWSVGLIEVGFSKYCPFTFGTRRHSLLMDMAYGFDSVWPL